MLKYLSVCSGIEAATVAWHPLGWEPVAFAEIETFPSALLAHHYPNTPNLGDMTQFRQWTKDLLSEVDLVVGGIPCVAFSVAGARNSLSDPRGQLTLTYVQLINYIDQVRKEYGKPPVIVVYENVPGIYSTRDNAFGCLVGALCGQDEAIETETGKWPTTGVFWGEKRRVGYRTFDAQYFGVAQRRRRCFIIAVANETIEHFGNQYCPSEILSIAKSLRGDTPPSRKTWKAPTTHAEKSSGADIFPGSLLAFNYNAQVDQMNFNPETTATLSCSQGVAVACFNKQGSGSYDDDDVGSTMMSRDYKSPTDLIAFPIDSMPLRKKDTYSVGFGSEDKPSYTLGTHHSHAVAYAIVGNSIGRQDHNGPKGHAIQEEVCFTQTACDQHAVGYGMVIRRLTPMEGERLQGFPDLYTQVPYKGKPTADGPRYKAIGNSMAVPVMRYIGLKIQEAVDYEEPLC